MNVIEKTRSYVVLSGCTTRDDDVWAIPGKGYATGEFDSDPEGNRIHSARCDAIEEEGIDVEEDVVVVFDKELQQRIDNRISEILRS